MTLVSTMISMARTLRLRVIAEGADSEEQAEFLKAARRDEMQGYLISKPFTLRSVKKVAEMAKTRQEKPLPLCLPVTY